MACGGASVLPVVRDRDRVLNGAAVGVVRIDLHAIADQVHGEETTRFKRVEKKGSYKTWRLSHLKDAADGHKFEKNIFQSKHGLADGTHRGSRRRRFCRKQRSAASLTGNKVQANWEGVQLVHETGLCYSLPFTVSWDNQAV